jgi:tRNA/rRNA methyltransferase
VALVFGPEDHGLANDDLKHCNRLMTIPTSADYTSLNLAQAVMVCVYEIFLAAAPRPRKERHGGEADLQLAPAKRVAFVFTRLQEAFLRIGFLPPENPDHIMFAVRRLLGRAGLEEREVRILLALARQIEWSGRRRTQN